jgi:hypothetical protein
MLRPDCRFPRRRPRSLPPRRRSGQGCRLGANHPMARLHAYSSACPHARQGKNACPHGLLCATLSARWQRKRSSLSRSSHESAGRPAPRNSPQSSVKNQLARLHRPAGPKITRRRHRRQANGNNTDTPEVGSFQPRSRWRRRNWSNLNRSAPA